MFVRQQQPTPVFFPCVPWSLYVLGEGGHMYERADMLQVAQPDLPVAHPFHCPFRSIVQPLQLLQTMLRVEEVLRVEELYVAVC